MEKFASFGKITDEFLNGKLEELVVDYENDHMMAVKVSYEYNNYYTIDYEVEIDITSKEVNFRGHSSQGYLNKVDLNREKGYEQAVSKYFFQ